MSAGLRLLERWMETPESRLLGGERRPFCSSLNANFYPTPLPTRRCFPHTLLIFFIAATKA